MPGRYERKEALAAEIEREVSLTILRMKLKAWTVVTVISLAICLAVFLTVPWQTMSAPLEIVAGLVVVGSVVCFVIGIGSTIAFASEWYNKNLIAKAAAMKALLWKAKWKEED